LELRPVAAREAQQLGAAYLLQSILHVQLGAGNKAAATKYTSGRLQGLLQAYVGSCVSEHGGGGVAAAQADVDLSGVCAHTCLHGADKDGESIFNIRADQSFRGKPRFDHILTRADSDDAAGGDYYRLLGLFTVRCALGAYTGAIGQHLERARKPAGAGRVSVIPGPYVKAGKFYTDKRQTSDSSIFAFTVESIMRPAHVLQDNDHPHHYYVNDDMLFMFQNAQEVLS
jgi:hypothetical protein